jgi:hypothetical protein
MRAEDDCRGRLYAAAESAGLKILSDDKCCRLLAWLYVRGGGREEAVFDGRLNGAFLYAQKRLGLLQRHKLGEGERRL